MRRPSKILERLLPFFKGSVGKVTRAYFVQNPKLVQNFDNFRDTTTDKHSDTGALFRKDDWKKTPDAAQRKLMLSHLYQGISHFRPEFNDGLKVGN